MSSIVKFVRAQCPGCRKIRTINRMVEPGCVFAIVVCDDCFVNRPELRRFDPLWINAKGSVINFCAVAGMRQAGVHAAKVVEILSAIIQPESNQLADGNVLLASALESSK